MRPAVALVTFLLAVDLHAFTGILQFPDGSPCARCTVSVVDHAATGRADAAGRFELNPVPKLPFQIIVVAANGVVYPAIDVTREGGITVTPAHQESITVVSGVAPSIESSPAAAESMIAREDLEIRAPATVADAIAAVPGASKSDAGLIAVPSIRGLARGRTVLLLDGARVTAERRAGSSATYVDPFSLAAVELARGAGGVGYGSDAFGGVIELLPRYPEPATGGQVFYQVGGAGGGSELASGGVEISGGSERHAVLLDLHARSGGDDETPDGRALTTSYRARGFALRYRGALTTGEFRAAFSVDEGRDIERPTADSATRPTTYPIENSRRLNLAADLGAHLGFERTRVEGFAGTYRLVLERGEITATGMGAEVSDVDANDASLRALAGRALAGGWLDAGYDFTTRFGLEAIVTKEAPDTEPVETVAIEEAYRTDHGLFASWSRPLGARFVLGAGVRGDAVRSVNEGGYFGDRSADHVAPSGHLSVTAVVASDLSATLQLSSGFRDPTLSDRYYRGPSGRGTITGNPDLDPERSVQADGALRWSRGRSRAAIYGYHYTIRDLIERYRVGRDYFFRNRGEATLYGGELEAFFPLWSQLGARAGVAIARGATSEGDALDDIPAPDASLEMRWAYPTGYLFGEARHVSDDDRPGPTELARDRYTTLDLGAGWRFARAMEVRVVLRNVTNEEYFASADEMSELGAGRSVTVMLSGLQIFGAAAGSSRE